MLLRLYEKARASQGLPAAIPHLSAAPPGSAPAGEGNALGAESSAQALLESLQRTEIRRQAREEGHVFKPSL